MSKLAAALLALTVLSWLPHAHAQLRRLYYRGGDGAVGASIKFGVFFDLNGEGTLTSNSTKAMGAQVTIECFNGSSPSAQRFYVINAQTLFEEPGGNLATCEIKDIVPSNTTKPDLNYCQVTLLAFNQTYIPGTCGGGPVIILANEDNSTALLAGVGYIVPPMCLVPLPPSPPPPPRPPPSSPPPPPVKGKCNKRGLCENSRELEGTALDKPLEFPGQRKEEEGSSSESPLDSSYYLRKTIHRRYLAR